MRLASRIFLTTAVLTLALVGIGAWSLRAVNELVHVNHAIIDRSVPALRAETLLEESMLALVRLDARYSLLGDPAYATLWHQRADRMAAQLDELRPLLRSSEERRRLRKAATTFDAYRALAPVMPGPRRRNTKPAAVRRAAARSVRTLRRCNVWSRSCALRECAMCARKPPGV